MIAALYGRRATGTGAIAGLVAGVGVSVLFLLRPEQRPIPDMHEGVYGLLVNVPVLVGVSWLTRPQAQGEAASHVEV
jgi:SSS family solute:Na+ symporter